MRRHRTLVALMLTVATLGGCAGRPAPAPTALVSQPAAVRAEPVSLPGLPQRQIVVMLVAGPAAGLAAVTRALLERYPMTLVTDRPFASIAMHGYVFQVAASAATGDVIAQLSDDPRVALVQPLQGFGVQADATAEPAVWRPSTVVDRAGDVAAAHAVATGRGVRVAIVDTGVDRTHPDLSARIVLTRNFVDDGRGDDVPEAHGTAMAGVIAAAPGNAAGIQAVAPDATLLGLRGCSEDNPGRRGLCSSFSLGRAIDAALLERADVINLSLEGPADPLITRLVLRALDMGVVVVAARGRPESFPASLMGVIAAERAEPTADLATPVANRVRAPGTDILTTSPGRRYDLLSGSSLAAAWVSGVAALLREVQPGLPPSAAAAILEAQGQAVPVSACWAINSVLGAAPAASAAARCVAP